MARQPDVHVDIHVFHFEASDDPVSGAPYPYVVGFDDDVGVYLSEPNALAADTADRLPDVFIDVLQRGDLDGSEHVAHLLQGRHPTAAQSSLHKSRWNPACSERSMQSTRCCSYHCSPAGSAKAYGRKRYNADI